MLGGVYRGVLLDTNPDGRILVRVPAALGAQAVWAEPCAPTPVVRLGSIPRNIGVWVMFEGGDRAYPVWVGFYAIEGVMGDPTSEVVIGPIEPSGPKLWVKTSP